ncbi:MAG: ribosome maturation factor RimM [Hyphomicrobiaceae bacterium]
MPDKILLGQITGAHGIRGDVVLRTFTAEPDAIADYGPLSDRAGRRFVISGLRVTPKGVIARLEGISDRTAAEKLRGTELFVDRARLPAPEDGAFYYEDLVGLTAALADGTVVGKVVAIQNYGAGDLVEVAMPGKKQTELLPFTDAFVPTVDIAGGRIIVVLPSYTSGDANEGADPGDRQSDDGSPGA